MGTGLRAQLADAAGVSGPDRRPDFSGKTYVPLSQFTRPARQYTRYTGPVHRALMWLNLAGGLGIAAVGVFLAQQMQLVIVSFSLIGVIGFVQMWRFRRQPPADPRWWLREHLTAMLGNGVATHIAFLSIGLPKLLPMLAGPALANLAWLGPLVVAAVAGAWLVRKYLPRRAAPAGREPAAG